jgi:hypothetical protein
LDLRGGRYERTTAKLIGEFIGQERRLPGCRHSGSLFISSQLGEIYSGDLDVANKPM